MTETWGGFVVGVLFWTVARGLWRLRRSAYPRATWRIDDATEILLFTALLAWGVVALVQS